MVDPPPPGPADDAAQRHVLQRRIARLCMVMFLGVCVVDLVAWRTSGDPWKLAVALFMAGLALLFAWALWLARQGRHRRSLQSLLWSMPVVIAWIMVTGGAATFLPTMIAALAMMLLVPDTVHPGIFPPRRWMLVLLAAYTIGMGLRLALRGLDFTRSPTELAIVVLVPATLLFLHWLLIQRVFRTMRAALAESEALRRAHEQRNHELLASQAALERASGAKSQFLANMSHELRTPLNIILGYTEILEEELAGQPERGGDLAKIHAAGSHLLTLISDILDLSKIEAGKVELFPAPFSLSDLAREAAESCQPLIARLNNRLRLELDPRADEVETDRLRLRQILLNLLANAAKFTSDGDITLRTGIAAADRVFIEVADTGPGITLEAQGRIFDAFEQADSSPTRSHGGTGLGLTLVRRFAQLLGGEVSVVSSPGAGALFRVELPRRPPAQ